jgi:(1->4)-alpha-D-glucan 1-alpha-D-glucosylmutase
MAKAVEDTLFYRFNRLVSANEVGADPGTPTIDPEDFHAFATARAESHPMALNATATHDTKRGEDARMRIAAISEAPERWIAAVDAFEDIFVADPDVPDIDSNMRWLFYQALVGSWVPGLGDVLLERTRDFLLKAARESKVHTSWVKTDRDYEARLEQFVERAMASGAFVRSFAEHADVFVGIGHRKSLAQLALKLTLPGIPDIYQGTEVADLSFVDPDNRRPVDFDRLRILLEQSEDDVPTEFEAQKLALIRFGLDLRAAYPGVFAGGYRPISIGKGLIAFAREGGGHALLVVIYPTVAGLEGGSQIHWPESREPLNRPIRSFPHISDDARPMSDAVAAHLREVGVSLTLFEA